LLVKPVRLMLKLSANRESRKNPSVLDLVVSAHGIGMSEITRGTHLNIYSVSRATAGRSITTAEGHEIAKGLNSALHARGHSRYFRFNELFNYG
jgi:hypothetical protein